MISVITPVWNRSDLTANYLLQNHMHYSTDTTVQWIIIDNGSTDGTGGILEYWKDIIGPRLVVLKNETNLGFPTACNQGAERAEGETLLFLNNDIEVKGDYLSIIERELADNPDSLVGAQLAARDTGWNVFGGQIISYLVGWCLGMSYKMFRELGGFDEIYSPAYYEDIDLCYNAIKAGYQLRDVWLPLSHIGEQSGGQLEDRDGITETNRQKFAEKWGLKC